MISEEKKEVNNIAWLIFDKLCIILSNLVVILFVANHYGASEYGKYQYALSIVVILETISQLIDGRIVKKKYAGKLSESSVVFNVTIIRVMFSMGSLFIGVILVFYFSLDNELATIILVLLIDSIVKNFRFGMENRFEYHLHSKKNVISADIGLLLCLIFQVIAVYLDASIITIGFIQLSSSLISIAILFILYKKEFKHSSTNDFVFGLCKDIIIESLPLGIAIMANVMYSKCDSIMLGLLLSTTEVGVYNISIKIISVLIVPLAPIQTTLYVRMLHIKSEKKLYSEWYLKNTSIFTWIGIFGIVASVFVLPVFFGVMNEDYKHGLTVTYCLLPEVLFYYNAILRANHLVIMGRSIVLLITQVITVVFNCFMNYFFILRYGINGAAYATVLCQFISLIASNIIFKDTRDILNYQLKAFNPKYIYGK